MAKHLLKAFAHQDPDRFANLLGSAEDITEALAVLDLVPDEIEGEVISRLSAEMGNRVLQSLSDASLVTSLESGSIDSGRKLLARVGPERAARLIAGVNSRGRRRQLRQLIDYSPGTIGTLLQPAMLSLSFDVSATDVLKRIRLHRGHAEEPVVILDERGVVAGVLDLMALLNNQDAEATAVEFCLPVKPLLADSLTVQAADYALWEGHSSLPVVDYQGKPVGYVTRTAVEAASGETSQVNVLLNGSRELVTRFWQFLGIMLVFLIDRRNEK